MKVSVIIPHWNDLENLAQCLLHLRAQTVPREEFEIVVADNNSACGLDAVRAVCGPDVMLVEAREQGAGPARNAAIAASKGVVLALIDSDCFADPEWLEMGIAGLADFDFVGGHVRVHPNIASAPNAVEAFEAVFAFDFRDYIERQGFTGTGNMFVSRGVFDAVGPFRNGVSEDVEWSHRARTRGFRLGYVPQARVTHPARHDWPALRSKWEKATREAWGLVQGNPRAEWRWLLKASVMPLSAFAHVPKVLMAKAELSFGQRMKAILVLIRLRAWRGIEMLRLWAKGQG